jgi:hypothetical protein
MALWRGVIFPEIDVGKLARGKMRPEKSRERLQTSCLTMCRRQPGCRHLQRVVIGRTKSIDGGPNWELLAFEPELPSKAYVEAMKAVDILRQVYALALTTTRR